MATENKVIDDHDIETIKCESWENFKSKIPDILEENKKLASSDPYVKTDGNIYFRGHADADWNLETTLERTPKFSKYSDLAEYCLLLGKIYPVIKSMNLNYCPEFSYDDIRNKIEDMPVADKSLIEYLAFVRHLGFPSPLLDWSRSHHVAAFFAFSTCRPTEGKNVAIYMLQHKEMTTHTGDEEGLKCIHVIGHYVRTHKRHFLQQSNYTIAGQGKSPFRVENFIPHNQCLKWEKDHGNKNSYLRKYVLPSTEKTTALHDLDSMNINAYSLYGTDEALMDTLFNREALFKD